MIHSSSQRVSLIIIIIFNSIIMHVKSHPKVFIVSLGHLVFLSNLVFFFFFFFCKVIFPRRAGLDRKHNVAYIKSFPVGRENSRIFLVKNPP